MTTDRREPLARYVLFADMTTQARFVATAEEAYRTLVKADRWGAAASVTIGPATVVTERRGVLRRPVEVTLPAPTAPATPSLAAAAQAGEEVPGRVAALGGCTAEASLAAVMGDVVLDLVRDLARLLPSQQRDHPAHRQTLRLAAELEALATVLADVGCTDPSGCVTTRAPRHWGKRAEDVEISEVRAVLVQLAEKRGAEATPES